MTEAEKILWTVARAIAVRNGATLDAMRMSNRNKYWQMAQAAVAAYEKLRPVDEPTKRLVVAARRTAFETQGGGLQELDRASEAFASRVPWEDEPDHHKEDSKHG